ncbi:DNA primase [Lutispora saccharofermentans]|uniref:DNA primase n=1 Tax=Lutispora saccharofermentans TaxID=3024236 RepID=A0ABT1NHV1_9FIRM|nr:DNA primase [Lutispora saccharofermentans]MCQ1530822.1 DNA primase [Lutispora saccharofermentans]
MFFSEEMVSEIIEKNDIVDIISQYMNLKKRGRNYIGLCPFHSEKTPSFSVSQDKQLFYCFGCGEGGNVSTFIQKIERMTYPESLRFLAEKAGIKIEDTANKEDLEKAKRKQLLFRINKEAARFFYNNLSGNREAMKYLSNRGLSMGTIKKFGLGFSPDNWDSLKNFLSSKSLKLEAAYSAGLLVKKNNNEGYYDRFRNRVMFPIIDLKGNVIAFGGRVLDDSKPKYLNSPDTPIYNKGYNIYGLNLVKGIRDLRNIIVVEGYMDAISLHQYGINNAVASLGTAFTEHQARLLKRFANEIIIAYDSDAAGQNATLRGLSILEKEGCTVKVLRLPKGKDPDEYIRKEGLESFKRLVDNSMSLIDYKIFNLKNGINMENIEDRIKFIKQLANVMQTIDSPAETDAYIKKYSKEMQISEEAVYDELNRLKKKHTNGNNRHNIVDRTAVANNAELKKSINGEIIAEKKLINICIQNENKANYIFSRVTADYFNLPIHRRIAEIINLKIKEGKLISAGEIIIHLENEEDRKKAAEVFNIEITSHDLELMDSYIDKLLQAHIRKRIGELTKLMNEYYENGDRDKSNEIFKEIMELQKKKK